MPLERILKYLDLIKSDLLEHFNSFVPYIYIDGHRNSGINEYDV